MNLLRRVLLANLILACAMANSAASQDPAPANPAPNAPANQDPNANPAGQDPNAPNPDPNGGAPGPPEPAQFVGSWDLGVMVPGENYKPTYELSNGCSDGEDATVSYPTTIPLTGPPFYKEGSTEKYGLAPGQTMTLDLSLSFPTPPPGTPVAKIDPNVPIICPNAQGILFSEHKFHKWETAQGNDTLIHNCLDAQETYFITACVLPYQPGSQGGGGKVTRPPKRARKVPLGLSPPNGNACVKLWYFNVFIPSGSIHTPQDCAAYIRAEAHNLFDKVLAPYRAKDPAAWAWVPTGAAIDQLTAEQILTIKNLVFDALEKLAK